MALKKTYLSLLLCFLLLSGCATGGGLFSSEDAEPVNQYFTAEFADVQLPNELKEDASKTMITFAASGSKFGVQVFSGRVDTVYVMNHMRKTMSSNGWTLRSALRTKNSVMIFEKPDRMASIMISEGVVSSTVHVFVSPRLDGDSLSDFSMPASGNIPSSFE